MYSTSSSGRACGFLCSADDVPNRPERLDFVASRLRPIPGRQVWGEVVERLTVQRELPHTMVTERAELAGDSSLLGDAAARAHLHRRPERPAVGLRVCRFPANDVPSILALEGVDRVSLRSQS